MKKKIFREEILSEFLNGMDKPLTQNEAKEIMGGTETCSDGCTFSKCAIGCMNASSCQSGCQYFVGQFFS